MFTLIDLIGAGLLGLGIGIIVVTVIQERHRS